MLQYIWIANYIYTKETTFYINNQHKRGGDVLKYTCIEKNLEARVGQIIQKHKLTQTPWNCELLTYIRML